MKRLCFVLLLLWGGVLRAQYSYLPVSPCQKGEKGEQFYKLSKKDTLCISPSRESNRECLSFVGQVCRAENCDEHLEYTLFANEKEKRAFLLINRTNEVSLGCDIFLVEPKGAIYCGFLPVAAYTKDPDGRMDYNNIVPFVSIIRLSNRYLLAFETPLIVLYPFGEQEEILNGRDISYSFQNSTLQLHRQ